jgi:hypothetical protein
MADMKAAMNVGANTNWSRPRLIKVPVEKARKTEVHLAVRIPLGC